MTREEAVDYINEWLKDEYALNSKDRIVLTMAIEALSQDNNKLYIKIYANDEPSKKAEKLYQICDEIESQEVAQWLKEYFPFAGQPTGEWIEQESDTIEKIYLCSNCENYEAWGETEKTPYCPNCGAKMGERRTDD